jgi:ElaB/YqjD/DUF883 family membrane-anchored ribosome-binding protein
MPENATSLNESIEGAASTISEKISDTATQAKEKVSDLGRTAGDKIDENRDAAATGLDKAASALREKAESLPGGEKVAGIAHTAADKLSSTAEYVREHDVKRMMADVETLVKNNPGPSLILAAAIGFLVARAFGNND